MIAFLENEWAVGVVMAVIIFIVTFIVKLPIKAVTNKLFQKKTISERVRKIVNGIILFFPIAFGFIGEFLYSYYFLHTAFSGISGLSYGAGAISMYAVVERFFGVKNPYKTTDEGKAVQELVEKVQEDGKIDKSDLSAVDEFYKTIDKHKNKK